MRNTRCTECDWPLIKLEKVSERASKRMQCHRNISNKILIHVSLLLSLYATCNIYVFNTILFSILVVPAKILPQGNMDLIKPDPGLTQTNPEPNVYRCRKCRRVVAAKSNVVTHMRINATNVARTTEPKTYTYDPIAADAITSAPMIEDIAQQVRMMSVHSSERSSEGDSERCREIIFVEPIAWMTDVCKQTQGKLNCPKCQSKLGSFTWINGCNCPCGKQVSPAFYLVPSKVEMSRSVQNVQVTV